MRRSWLDWLTDVIDAVPAPRWVVYAASFAVWTLVTGIVSWLAAIRPFPEIVLSPVVAAAFPVVMLWAMQVLDRVAVRALAEVGPTLELDAAQIEVIARDLRRTPPVGAALAMPIGVAAGIGSVLGSPGGWELRHGDPVATWAVTAVVASVAMTVAIGFVVHAIHQLRLVDAIHRRSVTVDLFRLEPLYAFAKLTSLTGMTLIGIGIGGLLLVSIVIPSFELAPTDFVTFGGLLLVAIACFVVPLLGLHDRIEAERDRRLAEAQATLAIVLAEVRRRVAAGDVDGAAKINDAVEAASTGVEAVSRVSTWPWRTETLRGFMSAVFLPILLWLMITLLGRALPG